MSIITGTARADNLNGTADAGKIYGGDGNDTLSGGNGNDALLGGAGDDLLDGGAGNETLYGGTSSDVFYFGNVNTSSILMDFASGIDVIRLSTAVADDFSDLVIGTNSLGHATISAHDVFITIKEVHASGLSASDFQFA